MREPYGSTDLRDWLSSWVGSAACELTDDHGYRVYLIRTSIGAEHFLARVLLLSGVLDYATVGELLDTYGSTRTVMPH